MSEKVEVKIDKNSFRVYSKNNIAKDEIIFNITGYVINKPTRFTIQTDVDKHIDFPADINILDSPEFNWRYINHSCSPNCYCNVKDMTIRAKFDIEAKQELTFNYHTTEYDMAAPFQCNCKSDNCIRWISGFKYLSEEQQEAILPFVAEHILILHEREIVNM